MPSTSNPDEPKPLASRLRDLRKSKGLSVKDVARMLGDGVHFTTVSKLETGKMQLTLDWLDRFVEVYEINPRDILSDYEIGEKPRLVPEYPFGNWPPQPNDDPELHSQTYILTGGPKSFSLLLFDCAPDLADDFPIYSLTIDPDQKALFEGATYAIYAPKLQTTMVGVFRDSPARFVPYLSRLSVITLLKDEGEGVPEVIGRVVASYRHLGSRIG